MSKTHWKKLHNPDYLGAYALEPGEDMISTIDYVGQEEITGNGGKKETGMVCHFAEKGCKPMILNATNSKTIEKIHGTPYIEEWHGKQIQIYIASVAAFGDTVEALAGEMGVDAANLQASIDAYNAVVEGGTDEFGFVADNTADAAMTEGPWYACRKVPTVHHTMGGIRVNVESEACNADGEPIPGLYAAGECTGGIHGENRLGGNAIADCMTFGRNAGTNAAKYALA